MKIPLTSLFSSLIISIISLTASAQNDTVLSKCPLRGNWYIGAAGGTQVLFSADADKLDFGNRLSTDLSLSAGKWFTPALGMRFNIQGFKLKGLSTAEGLYIADPLDGNILYGNEDPVRNYATINPDGSYRHDVYYINAGLGLQLSIMSLINATGERPPWDIIPGAGMGYMHVFDHEGTPPASVMTTNFSITGKYRINERLDVNAALHASFFPDQFDGRIMGRGYENNLGLTAGITFHLGRQGFNHKLWTDNVMPMSGNTALMLPKTDTIVVSDTVYIEKEIPVPARQDSFKAFTLGSVVFNINSLSPKDGQDLTFLNIAGYLQQNPGKKVSLDAYTDRQTGSEKFNHSLSKGRAA